MEVGGFNNLEIDKYMSGLGKIIFAEKADRQMTGNLKEIVVWVGQLKCSASYTNVNLTGENAGRTVFQVRYSGDLVSELRKIFSPNSDNYDAVGGKLEVYSGKVGELTFKCLER